MKKIRSYLIKSKIMGPLAVLFLLFSCQNFDEDQIETKNFEDLTGEEIFLGVFFSTGSLTEKIPQLKKNHDFLINFLDEDEMDAFLKSHNEIISMIKKNKPNSFEDFENAMTSGNHYIIMTEIKQMTQNLVEVQEELLQSLNEKDKLAVKNLASLDKIKVEEAIRKGEKTNLAKMIYGDENLDPNYQPLACSLAVTCTIALVFTIAVAVTAAVVVATAIEGVYVFDLAIALSRTIGVESAREDFNSLELETLVNSLAMNLNRN